MLTQSAGADAVIVNRAMQANTIMEAFVERDAIVVELEIGATEAPAFRALVDEAVELPAPVPASALSISADGIPLHGVIQRRRRQKRVERDEISGDPLPREGTEEVVFVELRYPLKARPEKLVIGPPLTEKGYAAADIGFVVYHEGIAINDFRYLAMGEPIDLDWDDPFYSRFERRTLNRQHSSPMNVFLYVEPFEVRKEFVVRALDLARFTDIDVRAHEPIAADRRESLLREIADCLRERAPVTIDGAKAEPILDRIHFLKPGLRMTRVLTADEPLDGTNAIVGAIFVYPIDGLPKEVSLSWDLFDERILSVPAAATDEAGSMPSLLSRDDAELRWVNYLKGSDIPAEMEVADLKSRLSVPAAPLAGILVALGLLVVAWRRRSLSLALGSLALVLAGWLARPLATIDVPVPFEARVPSGEEAAPTIHALLYNAYRALDFRDEELVFDRLAQSLAGDVLERIYLEMRKGLRLESQGGAQVRVTKVELIDVVPQDRDETGALRYRARWNVTGSVGHWGHTHMRTNVYDALLTLAQLEGRWRIADVEILDEQRALVGQP